MKIHIKTIVVGFLVIMCLLITYYYHYVIKTQIIFTHVFYIPIVISSIYWKRAGILIAIFLGVFVYVSQIISSLGVTSFDLIRSLMFVVVALVITIIMNRNKEMSIRLKQTEKCIALNKELNETNEQLRKTKKQVEESAFQLRELNATKDKLFSIIAHDLRSPFNSILGFSDLLIENFRDYDSEKIKGFLYSINSTSKHTLVLLENLLDWAKLQTGQISFVPEKIALNSVIQEIKWILDAPAQIKNIALTINLSDHIEVHADKNMVQTILRNLVSNAIKFTNAGGMIEIKVVSDQTRAEITVSDNGIGMNDEKISKLFRFDACSSEGTAKEKGSGLGLILCKEFVEKQGGKIWITSELGRGTEVKFTLPVS